MSDNIIIVGSGGTTHTMQAKDNTTFKTPYHAIAREDGTVPLKIVAEDAAHSSGDSGIMMLGVRADTAAALGGTDGDYMPPIMDANGRMHVIAALAATQTLATVTTVSTVTTCSTVTALTGGNTAHDAAATAIKPHLIGGFASAAAPTDVSADLDAVQAWFLRNGAQVTQPSYGGIPAVAGNGAVGTGVQRVTIANDSTGILAAVTNVATIGTSVTPGGGAAHLGKAEDAAHSSGDTGVFVLAVANSTHTTTFGSDGDYTPIAVDTTGKVGIRGTFAEDVAHTSGDLGIQTLAVRTDVSAALSGTTGDYSPLITDEAGKLWTHECVNASLGVTSAAVTSADLSGAATAITDAPTSTKKLVIVDILISVGSTLAVTFTEETSGTVIAKLYLLANTTYHFKPHGKIKLATADKKLMAQASGAGNLAITTLYRSET